MESCHCEDAPAILPPPPPPPNLESEFTCDINDNFDTVYFIFAYLAILIGCVLWYMYKPLIQWIRTSKRNYRG